MTWFDQFLMDTSSVHEQNMVYDSDCFSFSFSKGKALFLKLVGKIMSKY